MGRSRCCGCYSSCGCSCALPCCSHDATGAGAAAVKDTGTASPSPADNCCRRAARSGCGRQSATTQAGESSDERSALTKAGGQSEGSDAGRRACCGCDKYVRRCVATFCVGVALCMVFGFIPVDPGRPTSVPRMNYWVYQFANLQWFSFGSASQHILSYATAIPGPGGRSKLAIMVFSNLVCAGFATLLYFTGNINNTLGRVYPGFVPPLVMLAFYFVWTVVKLEPQYARLRRHAQAKRLARMLARNQRAAAASGAGAGAALMPANSGYLQGDAGLQQHPNARAGATPVAMARTRRALDGEPTVGASATSPPLTSSHGPAADSWRRDGTAAFASVASGIVIHPRASRSGSAPALATSSTLAINDTEAPSVAGGTSTSTASLVVPPARSRRSGSMVVGRYGAMPPAPVASVGSGLAHDGSAHGSVRASGADLGLRVPHSPSSTRREVRFLSDATRATSAPLLPSMSFGGMSDLSGASSFYATLSAPDVHKECNIVLDWVDGGADTAGHGSDSAEDEERATYGSTARQTDAPGRFLREASSTDTSFSAVSGRFKLYRRPLAQLVVAACFSWLIVAIYLFCEWFAVSFQKPGSSAQQHQTIYYGLFVLITLAIKAVLKMVGFVADMGKHGCSPCYFQGELIGLLNYYNFYRLLFANVETSWVFAGLQFLHCTHEWVVYPMRATSWYYRTSMRVTRRVADGCCSPLRTLLRTVAQSQLSEEEWKGFICMDYGLRCATELATMVVFVSAFTWMRFGYNSQHFLFFAAVSDERYRRVMYYCAVAFSVELVNVAAAQLLFFGPRKLSVMGRLSNLFRNKSFILYGLASVGSLSINIFISNVDVAQLVHNSPIPAA